MTRPQDEQRRLHYELSNVGLRAQATAVGLVQLCVELRRANVLDGGAIERVKDAIADEVMVAAPRPVATPAYRQDIKARLDRLFAGEQTMGSAGALSPATPEEPV